MPLHNERVHVREQALACGRHRRHSHPSPFSLKCGKTNDRLGLAPANENQTQSPVQSLPLPCFPFPFSGLEPAMGQDKGLWQKRVSKAPLEAAAPRAQGPASLTPSLARSLGRALNSLTRNPERKRLARGQSASLGGLLSTGSKWHPHCQPPVKAGEGLSCPHIPILHSAS